jgi:hypothetical protein
VSGATFILLLTFNFTFHCRGGHFPPLHLASILPKLLPYRRLKKFAIFAAVGSLESVGIQQLRQYTKHWLQSYGSDSAV